MKTKIAITLGAMALSVASGAAYAGSMTVPGETVGIAIGAPLPEGVYFVDTASFGSARFLGDSGWADFSIPVVAWSTPWTFFGGRVEAYAAAPVIAYGRTAPNTVFNRAIYNPALLVGEAWSLGNGWNFSPSAVMPPSTMHLARITGSSTRVPPLPIMPTTGI